MEKLMPISRVLLCVVLVLHAFPARYANEFGVEDEREFDYTQGSKSGPERWGELHEEWSLCKNGNIQSPIDLSEDKAEAVSNLGKLKRMYKPCKAVLKNRGHDIMMNWEGDAGGLEINGTHYALKQLHWHAPAEHVINGKRFDLEMHLVHEGPGGKLAVVSLLYTIGKENPFLTTLMDDLEVLSDGNQREKEVGVVDPRLVKFCSKKYYRYIGSLTVPPCTEGVVWTVIDEENNTVTDEQVKLLHASIHDVSNSNSRPTQPVNGRPVRLHTQKVKGGDN